MLTYLLVDKCTHGSSLQDFTIVVTIWPTVSSIDFTN